MDPEIFQFLRKGIILYIILASSIAIHEWAHAITADKLGDELPRLQGRVTLNPLAHLDLIGTGLIPLLMIFGPLVGIHFPIALIGWGRPVQISLFGVKSPIRADLLITAAGPFSNLVLCFLAAIAGGLLAHVNPQIMDLFGQIIFINAILIVFNLVPIPPLDGAHFLRYAVGMSEATYLKFSNWGFLIMLVLINLPIFQKIFYPIISTLTGFFLLLASQIAS